MDAYRALELYWGAQNIGYFDTLGSVILFSIYFVAVLFVYFYVINMTDVEACEKKIRWYGIFFSPLHVDKERRKRKTYYLQDRDSCTQYCARWAPKVILGTWFFTVPEGHISWNLVAWVWWWSFIQYKNRFFVFILRDMVK